MEYYNCDYVKVGYDETGKFTYMVIKRAVDSDSFRMAHDKALKIYREKRPGKHLADTSNMGMVTIEDQQFVANKVIPKMVQSSPDNKLKIAVLVSDEVFSMMAVKAIPKKASEGVVDVMHSIFNSYDKAVNWLKGVEGD